MPLCLSQLVWLKIDCPYDGSLKGLCLNFFDAVDRVLSTDYLSKFIKNTHTIDALLTRMAQIASLHCLGVLVIDEIQHLSLAKSGGSEKMLNFFVTLVNTIGVPVLLIGTTKAMPILQGEFRQARRGSGQGDLLWDRMSNDVSWEIMLRAMWKNQWTKEHFPLTEELKATIYDESQGIIDIAIKLYAMAQIKAIATGSETFSALTIREVAAEKLRLVKPMLDALRSGDIKRLSQYEDIRPISIEDYLVAYSGNEAVTSSKERKTTKINLHEQAILKLLELGIQPPIAKNAVNKVLVKEYKEMGLAVVVQKALLIALNVSGDRNPGEQKQEDDLRELIEEDAHSSLKSAGMIAESNEEL